MKIALFTDTYPPRINGVATSVSILKKHLEAMGHKVLTVTTTDPGVTEPEDGIIRIPSIPFKTQRLATAATPKDYIDITLFHPDVIHTHSEYTLGIMGRTMALGLRRPLVHTMHTVWEYYTKHLIDIDVLDPVMKAAARKYTALICNHADKVIVPTHKVEQLLYSYKVHKEIVIIPTGIDIERFSPENTPPERLSGIRRELGIHPGDKVILNIGRVEKEKFLDDLLNMLCDYLIRHKYIKFVVVGDGTAKEELIGHAGKLGIGEQVIFTGSRPWNEIHHYYRLGDVFVSASISETQGLTYTEAMASGVPVVAKRDGCLENLLIEGENGYMFDDGEELVAAIDKIIGYTQMHKRFSEKAFESAKKFSSKAYAQNVLGLYEQLVP